MAYKGALMVDDETLFRTMQVAAETGALVMVHAENGDAIDVLVREALAAGQHRAALPRADAPARARGRGDEPRDPARPDRRRAALRRPRHVQGRGRRRSRRARAKNWDVWGETCTQYFFTDITDLDEPDFGGAKYVFSPPVRDKANQPVLWDAVRTDVLSAISTDHCAFLLDGQKTLGKDDFSKIPNGAPGLEDRLRMIHHFGVNEGRITLNRMVELLSTNPAKLFGLYPRKGTIAPGSDADIVIFDPNRKTTISAADPALEVGLQPLRGHRGDGRRRRDADPRHRRRRRTASCRSSRASGSSSSARGSASSCLDARRGARRARASLRGDRGSRR